MRGPQRVNPDEVLGIILQRAPISRSDLARETGLSRAAVTLLVQELSALGIVEDNIPTVSATGRRATGIRLDLRRFHMVALRINRYALTLRVFDGSGRSVETVDVPIDPDIRIGELLALIESALRELLAQHDERFLLGIVLSTLGWLFETDGEIILHTDGFAELGKRDLRAAVRAMFPGVPVLLEHDAKTSALAAYQDHVAETGREPSCLLNIVGGIGFGGGIIIDGKIFRGSHGVAGEVGHLGINFNSSLHTRDIEKKDFNGLFEDYASPRALRRHVTNRLIDFPESSLSEASTPDDIHAAFEAGDPLAVWAIERVCRLTAYGLAGLCFVLDPDVIVLGDAFPASDVVLARIRADLADYLPSTIMDHLEVKISHRGTEGVLYGSYVLLIQAYLADEALYARIQGSLVEQPS